jgi:hypothetical protein
MAVIFKEKKNRDEMIRQRNKRRLKICIIIKTPQAESH